MPSGSERSSSHNVGDEKKPDEEVKNPAPEKALNASRSSSNLEGSGGEEEESEIEISDLNPVDQKDVNVTLR